MKPWEKFIPNPSTYKIAVNEAVCKSFERIQYRFPKSKKKRIRKKWRKDKTNFRNQEVHRIIKLHDTFFVTQRIYDKLMQGITCKQTTILNQGF